MRRKRGEIRSQCWTLSARFIRRKTSSSRMRAGLSMLLLPEDAAEEVGSDEDQHDGDDGRDDEDVDVLDDVRGPVLGHVDLFWSAVDAAFGEMAAGSGGGFSAGCGGGLLVVGGLRVR